MPANTVHSEIEKVHVKILQGFELIELYKKEVAVAKKENNVLREQLFEWVYDFEEDIKPETHKDYKELRANMKVQKKRH